MPPGQNLAYVLVAFALVWLVFFGYAVILARQVDLLRREVEALRGEFERRGQA